jgi:nicotinate-nucleotide adenylyltransferase
VDLPKWRATEGILDQAELLVVPRPDARGKVPASLKDRYTLLAFNEDEISSTEVRRRLEEGVQLNGMLPDPVERLIHEKGYYHAHR